MTERHFGRLSKKSNGWTIDNVLQPNIAYPGSAVILPHFLFCTINFRAFLNFVNFLSIYIISIYLLSIIKILLHTLKFYAKVGRIKEKESGL